METLYGKNGLAFWSEQEIKLRRMVETYIVDGLSHTLKIQNRGFEFAQVEAPILTPREFVNHQYTSDDIYTTSDDLVLRPETTMGSYAALVHLLDPYQERKYKLPLVVWQHGKSFRREQDQPSKFMRLKEFYQLEFQIAYSPDTKNDYSKAVIPSVTRMISLMTGKPCINEASDRIPSYAEWTTDVICDGMEVCSISRRNDYVGAAILEVAIGTDRCVYQMISHVP